MSIRVLLSVMGRLGIVLSFVLLVGVRPGLAAADLSSVKTFNIDAQPLPSALLRFAEVASVQITGSGELIEGKASPGVIGTFNTEAALARLLQGTSLRYEIINTNTIAIRSAAESGRSLRSAAQTGAGAVDGVNGNEKAERSFSDRFRVAQATAGQGAEPSSVEPPSIEPQSTKGDRIQEVVVTAQRRTERLLDVPISIVALGAEELESKKLTSLSDLQFAVPGMAITTDGFANKIELRGVSNNLNTAPLVGVYLDEAAVTNGGGAQINPNTYDLERVEVLRGPQGTLYGQGSAGGTIRFITKNPVLDRFGMTASVTSLFTQDGSPSERINTAINVPLIDQQLGVRIVGTYDREGGWIDQPAAGLKDINGQDLTTVRIKSLWKPSPQFSASFMAQLYRDDRSTGSDDDARGNFTQAFNLTTTPKVSNAHDIYNLTLSYDFPVVKMLSTTTYLHEKAESKDIGFDVTYTLPLPGALPTTYAFLTPYELSNDHAWVEEFRLSSIGSGAWQWTVGVFYERYRDFFDTPSSYFDVPGPPGTPLPSPQGVSLTDILYKSWSAFGDVSYKLWEQFTVGMGARSFHESQDYVSVVDFGLGPTETDQTARFHSVDPRAYAQYKLSRDINIYASAAKGFRSGGFNASPTEPTFAPENVWTYEFGTKMSLLEGRLRTDTAIFYTNYKGYVVSGLKNPNDLYVGFSNAGNARIKGIESSVVWRPSDQWSLAINGDYLDTRFTRIYATQTEYEVGDPLDSAPNYQISSSAERDFAWSGRQLSMRLDYTRRGRMTFRLRNVGIYGESDVVNILGYYMNLHWSDSLSLNLFAQNLLNDRGLIVPTQGGTVRSQPRTYGIGFEVSF